MIKTIPKIKMIDINKIMPNPFQLRRIFDNRKMLQLADSIKENGILLPVIVRGGLKGYEIICGQRRVRAANIAGLKEIPCIVINASDSQCALLSLVENVHRENLDYVEEGEGYYNLISYHRLKKDLLQKKISVEQNIINDKIRMLTLSQKVRYKAELNKISEDRLRELLKLHDENLLIALINRIVDENLTVDQIKRIIKKQNRNNLNKNSNKNRKSRFSEKNILIYKNTIDKTIELLQSSGANITTQHKIDDNNIEYTIKIHK